MNYHEMTMNESKDSPQRRYQFIDQLHKSDQRISIDFLRIDNSK